VKCVVYLNPPLKTDSVSQVRGLKFFQHVIRNRFPPPQLEILIKKTGMFRKDCLRIRKGFARYVVYRPPCNEIMRDLAILPPGALDIFK